MCLIKTLIGCLCSLTISSAAATINSYYNVLPSGTQFAFIAQKMGDDIPVVDYQSQHMALPASTIKIVTALAALLELGDDYQFQTTLETNGTLRSDRLTGDLIARFSGDPTLRRTHLRTMLTALYRQGLRRIEGNLVIDTSVFAGSDMAPGWPWNDINHCFSTPPGAAVVDKNCFSSSLYSAANIGERAFIRTADWYPVNMHSEVVTVNADKSYYCQLDIHFGGLNNYTLAGCIRPRKAPLPLSFAVRDGAAWAGAILKAELQHANIAFTGRIVRQRQPGASGTIIAATRSAPLRDLLKVMLKKSDNLIADALFRTIANHYYRVPATWHAGSDAVRQILKKKAGIELMNTVLVDGSGLSRHNLISAATMMQILQYIGKNDNQLHFIAMLPLAGFDGTLRYRAGLSEAGLNGKASAKTGSLQGVYNLAGFMTTASGAQLAFVQFLSGYAVTEQQQSRRRVPLARFEQRLYRDIYQNN